MNTGILSSWTPGSVRKLKRHISEGLNTKQLAEQMGVSVIKIKSILRNEADDLLSVSQVPVPKERARTHVDFGNGIHGAYNPDLIRRQKAKRRRACLQKLYAAYQEREAAASASRDARVADKLEAAAVHNRKASKIEIMDAARQALEIGFDSIKQAKHLVAAIYEIPVEEITGKSRKDHAVRARHAAICAVKLRWPDMATLPLLAREFERDHTTILNALKLQGIDTSNQKQAA